MTLANAPVTPRHRGRPRLKEQANIHDRLIEAASAGMREKRHSELTAKEIAAAAHTTEGMIQYYFGSKDQLTITVLQNAVDHACTILRELKEKILQLPGNPTFHLARTIAELAERGEPTIRLHVGELVRKDSLIREKYIRAKANEVYSRIAEIIKLLVDAGIYRHDLDMRYATFVSSTLFEGPAIYASTLPQRNLSSEELRGDRWISFCADMLDQCFRARK